MQDKESTSAVTSGHDFENGTVNVATKLVIDAIESFNYAAWQNAVPVLRRLVIDNTDGPELSTLTVELSSSSNFANGQKWTIDRVRAGEKLPLKNVDCDISAEYLNGLDEAERGVLTFRLVQKGITLHEVSHVIRVLARDEWGGMGSMGELLPAFVTPNEPALAILLRSAGTLLGQHGYSTALDGYQSGDPNRAYMLAASLWSAVAGRQLIYAVPPGSFEQVGQKTRRIGTVLTDGLATCLDSSLLLASGLEAMGLNSVLIMTEGHCFAGVWLVNKTFQRTVEQDCSELRKAVTAKEFIVFETTLVTHRPAARFPDAIHTANQAIAEGKDREFVAAIDVARARMSQVRPLASHVVRQDPDADESEAGPVPLPASPGLEIVRSNDTPELPQTPAGRIERWQRKLLDLSLKNRLLNFAPSKQTVPILCPDLSRLEDLLAAGGKMKLVSLDDANPRGQRDADLHQKRTQKDLDQEFAKNAFDRKEIACPIEQRDLDVRLTALFRKVRTDLSEGGSNTLYLAVGFLRWKQKPDDERIFRAPLLLVPVTLTRRSASSAFHLSSHEDDVQFNATLAQMLKKDFDCDLSAFESNLPTDDSGVDVQQVLTRVRQAIRDVPGFEVIEEAAIAPFSFSKYLMWKDMVDRVGQLADNRVVRHLIHDPDKAFQTAGVGTMPQPHEIDRRYTPQDLVHPLPADSSQLAAVMAASEGHDFVIVGPPGTGKSQTIANIIAQCLAVKKTVLFVAEKTAALDVVYRRLREHGLGDCCVELHSNKAERKRFLDQLQNSWKNRRQADASDWVTINEQLRVRRDQLNEYVACIHHQELNGWTVYRAMGECVRGRELTTPRLVWPAATQHDSRQYAELREAVAELGSTYGAVPAEAKRLAVKSKDWSMAWETAFLETCRQLETASDALTVSLRRLKETFELPFEEDIPPDRFTPIYRLAQVLARPNKPSAEILSCTQLDVLKTRLDARSELIKAGQLANESLDAALREFCRVLGMPQSAPVSEGVKRQLYRLSNELVRAKPPLVELVFHERLEQCVQALADRPALLQSRDDSITALQSRSFNPVLIDRIPLDELETQWNKAVASFWPLSITRKNETKKRLAGYMTAGAVANPDVDLPLLFEYRANRASLNENLATMELPANLLNEVKKDATSLDSHITAAKRLREVISSTGLSIGAVRAATKGSLKSLVLAASQLYPPGHEVERLQAELKQSLADLGLSADLQAVVMRDPHALDQEILSALTIRETAIASGMAGDRLYQMLHVLQDAPEQLTCEVAAEYCRSAKSFRSAWTEYGKQASTLPAADDSKSIAKDAAQAARHVLSNRTALRLWTAWLGVQSRARKLGLDSFVEALETGALLAKDAVSRFELAFARWWLPLMIDRRKPLQKFQKVFHEDAIQQYRLLDDHARKAAEHRVRSGVLHDLPPADQAPRKSELGLLRHQMTLKRPSKSIREMISGMPGAFGKLAPCLLMSPLSIAQYLPVDQALFDVVVFDEASQIATWDAIGAIARGKQTIIVGDPKQLPPTNYFGKADNDEDNAELSDHEKDLESILDEAQASGLPTLQLNWHYRSRHESLIAFSNWNYYGNHLVTFPAAESLDRGVSLQYVAGAIYDRGKSRTNRKEAEAIVAALVERMKRCLTKPPHQRLTYGVVTFNTQQQELILDLLDDAQRSSPDLEWYFADDRIEPTFVKNLENVQGDERDVMMFSIAFGHDAAGKFPVDFGAINRDGGERRLNVAITRARQELVVFSSFLPDQLRAERSNARGVRDLKSFLEYADKGPEAMVARTDGSLGGFESPLEEAIASALEKRGWNIDTQVGVSGFRIDLGVVHPDKPGAYLAGIECDGMTYHRSAMARDRDKTRQQVLENLGWTIARVWSTDWWYDSDGAIEHLHAKLNEVLALSRQEQLDASPAALDEQADPESATEPPVVCDETPVPIMTSFSDFDFSDDIERLDKSVERSPLIAGSAPASVPLTEKNWYRRAILDDAVIHQTRFFDADYSDSLRSMAHAVLNAQSPILDDALAREVARAHGYNRTGYKIKQRVLEVLSDVTTTVESVGTFLWAEKTTLPAVPFRYPSNENERRSIDEIAHEELLGLLRERPELATSDDPALALAREMGLARLARSARERLEQVVEAYLGDS